MSQLFQPTRPMQRQRLRTGAIVMTQALALFARLWNPASGPNGEPIAPRFYQDWRVLYPVRRTLYRWYHKASYTILPRAIQARATLVLYEDALARYAPNTYSGEVILGAVKQGSTVDLPTWRRLAGSIRTVSLEGSGHRWLFTSVNAPWVATVKAIVQERFEGPTSVSPPVPQSLTDWSELSMVWDVTQEITPDRLSRTFTRNLAFSTWFLERSRSLKIPFLRSTQILLAIMRFEERFPAEPSRWTPELLAKAELDVMQQLRPVRSSERDLADVLGDTNAPRDAIENLLESIDKTDPLRLQQVALFWTGLEVAKRSRSESKTSSS